MIVFDYSDFERKANELSAAADQVPYALARSLNQAAEDAQTVLIVSTWPKAVHVRNTTFMRAALRCIHATRATSPSRSMIRCTVLSFRNTPSVEPRRRKARIWRFLQARSRSDQAVYASKIVQQHWSHERRGARSESPIAEYMSVELVDCT
jgi:hypothetical protein